MDENVANLGLKGFTVHRWTDVFFTFGQSWISLTQNSGFAQEDISPPTDRKTFGTQVYDAFFHNCVEQDLDAPALG